MKMTNRFITELSLRIMGLFFLLKIFDNFGAYFFSVYYSSILLNSESQQSFVQFYHSLIFIGICNCIIAIVLFFKAKWIAKKITPNKKEINIQLTPESLLKTILTSFGIIWLAKTIYSIPNFIDFIASLTEYFKEGNNNQNQEFNSLKFLIRATLSLIFIFKIDKISLWIFKKEKNTDS